MTQVKVGDSFAKIDDQDFDLVTKYTWHKRKNKHTTYAVSSTIVNGKKTTIRMHRLIMGANKSKVDHRDFDGLNNQRSNLRKCTQAQNNRSRRPRSNSGYLGVYANRCGTFTAKIFSLGRRITLGTFNDRDEAAMAYNKAAVKYHGTFANPNKL